LERITEPKWIPNYSDFLNLREKTTGIVQRRFSINNKDFHIFDVGGQISERKKWIHCFENVTALLFVVSLSSYNQTMYEDSTKNCMVDSMEIFKKMCNNKFFSKTHIILFFNKTDIFQTKIKNIPITDCPAFEDFHKFANDANDYDECTTYIKSKFHALNRRSTTIYTHFTCAMQRNNINQVFDDVQNIILMQNAKKLVPIASSSFVEH